MARRRRHSEVEFNLDGLTDVVTNLVGAIILLIVLVLGITRSASDASPATSTSPPDQTNPASRQSGLEFIKSLSRRIDTLHQNITAREVETRECESTVLKLRRAIRDRRSRDNANVGQATD